MTPRQGPIILSLLFVLVIGVLQVNAAPRLVAAILSGTSARYRDAHKFFVRTLAQKGYASDSVEIVAQNPNPDPISLSNTIRKFVALRADLIVAYGVSAATVAMNESKDIPVIFVDVYDPVGVGISPSMSMTGKRMTGVSSRVPMATLIGAARDMKRFRSLGVIFNSREKGAVAQMKEIKRIAALQGFAVTEANVASAASLERILLNLFASVDFIYVSESTVVCQQFERIARMAAEHGIPVMTMMPEGAEKGAIVSLEISPEEQGELAADYAVKILNGKNPGTIPIATPRRVELIFNMKIARALDLAVPLSALSAATRVIR